MGLGVNVGVAVARRLTEPASKLAFGSTGVSVDMGMSVGGWEPLPARQMVNEANRSPINRSPISTISHTSRRIPSLGFVFVPDEGVCWPTALGPACTGTSGAGATAGDGELGCVAKPLGVACAGDGTGEGNEDGGG